jgi:hypothetical protein
MGQVTIGIANVPLSLPVLALVASLLRPETGGKAALFKAFTWIRISD